MRIHPMSHVDHVPPVVLGYVRGLFAGRTGPFVVTIELPADLPMVECGLHGPAMGDAPVPDCECDLRRRPGRDWESRLVDRAPRKTATLTVVAVAFDGLPCVLATVFGGPAAPREPGDPALTDPDERAGSEAFWKDHALSR